MAVRRNAPEIDDYMDDEEELPRSRRRPADEDTEEERPSRRRRPVADDQDDEDEAPVRSRSHAAVADDDEEEDPDEADVRSSLIQSGWKAAKKRMSQSSDFTNDFRFDEEPQVVKFLRSDPLFFDQHWLDKKSGKKSYVCIGENCPLCNELGDTPTARYAWPVLNLSDENTVTQMLVCGTKLANQLSKHNESERTGPLDKQYWALSRTGQRQQTTYSVDPVKERDLTDDWDIDPAVVQKALANAKVPGPEAIQVNTHKELVEIARDLA